MAVTGAALLNEARTRAGLSWRVLAAKAGVPTSTVSRIEEGHSDPTLTMLERLLAAAGSNLVLTAHPRDDHSTLAELANAVNAARDGSRSTGPDCAASPTGPASIATSLPTRLLTPPCAPTRRSTRSSLLSLSSSPVNPASCPLLGPARLAHFANHGHRRGRPECAHWLRRQQLSPSGAADSPLPARHCSVRRRNPPMARGLLSSRDELETLFDDLAEELAQLGTTAEVVMVGGSWMLWHSQRQSTRDVDSARRFETDLSEVIDRVAATHDLTPGWLNDAAAAFWPAGASYDDSDVIYRRSTLVVRTPRPEVIFVMKLYRADPQDREDLASVSGRFATSQAPRPPLDVIRERLWLSLITCPKMSTWLTTSPKSYATPQRKPADRFRRSRARPSRSALNVAPSS